MAGERYSKMSEPAAFGFLANMLGSPKDSDGDKGSAYPRSDAEDQSRGARWIPGAVTMARRAGQKVEFVTECGPCCWYWHMPDGSRIYHFDSDISRQIARENDRTEVTKNGRKFFEGGVGPCPKCGNPHTSGGEVKP
jgi:hypothetical protein